jgi:hypothetical protein
MRWLRMSSVVARTFSNGTLVSRSCWAASFLPSRSRRCLSSRSRSSMSPAAEFGDRLLGRPIPGSGKRTRIRSGLIASRVMHFESWPARPVRTADLGLGRAVLGWLHEANHLGVVQDRPTRRRRLDCRTLWRQVKEYCRAAGIDSDRLDQRGIGIHSLRKTSIDDAIRNGGRRQCHRYLAVKVERVVDGSRLVETRVLQRLDAAGQPKPESSSSALRAVRGRPRCSRATAEWR